MGSKTSTAGASFFNLAAADDDAIPESGPTDPTDLSWGPLDGTPVCLYLRISLDKWMGTEDEAEGVKRQLKDGKLYAQRRGQRITCLRVDNDLSAFKRNVFRPAFEQMLTELATRAAGQGPVLYRGFIVADLDRLMRQPLDLERLITIFETKREDEHLISCVMSGEVDLNTDNGILQARMIVMMANKASKDTSRRVTNWHKWEAAEGRAVGGNRAFGWGVKVVGPNGEELWDRTQFNEKEKAAIEEAVEGILKGTTSLSAIAAKWNSEGLLTTTGGRWRKQSVKQLLLSPRLAGYRVRKGEIATDPRTGEKVMSKSYQGVISVDRWEALVEAVHRNGGVQAGVHNGGGRAKRGGGGRASIRYMLSGGLLTCHILECAQPLHGNRDPRAAGGFYYKCPCGKSNIPGGPADLAVTALFLEWAGRHGVVDGQEVAERWERQGELDDLLEELAELQAKFAKRELKAKVIIPLLDTLNEQISELEAAKAAHKAAGLTAAVHADLLEEWEAAETVLEKNVLLRRALATIIVWPAAHPGYKGRFDVNRLDPVWVEKKRAPSAAA